MNKRATIEVTAEQLSAAPFPAINAAKGAVLDAMFGRATVTDDYDMSRNVFRYTVDGPRDVVEPFIAAFIAIARPTPPETCKENPT